MSEYENFETFLEQVDEAMKGRIIRGVQYGGAGPEEWISGKKYNIGERVTYNGNIYILRQEQTFYDFEPENDSGDSDSSWEKEKADDVVMAEASVVEGVKPGDVDEYGNQKDEEMPLHVSTIGLGFDDDASTQGSHMSDSSSDDDTSTIIGSDDERGIEDEQDQEKLKNDISEAFDKILKLEKQKEQLNDKITNSEGAEVDEIIKKMNEIKKSIELRPPRDDLSIEEVVENEKVEWNETLDRSGMDIEEDGSTDEGEDLLDIIADNLNKIQIEEQPPKELTDEEKAEMDEVIDEVADEVIDATTDEVLDQIVDEAIEKAIKEDLINEHLKERYELLRKIYFENKNYQHSDTIYNVGTDDKPMWVYMWEEAYQEYETNGKFIRQIEENGKEKFVLMTDAEYIQWAQDNGKALDDETLEEEMKQIRALFEHHGAKGWKKRVLTPPTAARKRRRRRASSMSDDDIRQTIKNTLKYIGDISPNSQNEQLARMRQEPHWEEKLLDEERERRLQEPNPFIAPPGKFSLGSREQGGGGRKKRKNRTLKKKRNKFLVYLENLYG